MRIERNQAIDREMEVRAGGGGFGPEVVVALGSIDSSQAC